MSQICHHFLGFLLNKPLLGILLQTLPRQASVNRGWVWAARYIACNERWDLRKFLFLDNPKVQKLLSKSMVAIAFVPILAHTIAQ